MGFFSTVVNAATTVASKLLTEVLNPALVGSSGEQRQVGAVFQPIYTLGATRWGLYKGIPTVENALQNGAPVGITFSKSYIDEFGKSKVDSKYLQLDYELNSFDVSDLLSEYNTQNCLITVAPEDTENSSSQIRGEVGLPSPLKKLTTSISEISINDTFSIGDGILAVFRKQDNETGLLLTSAQKASHFSVNVQAISGTDVAYASAGSDDAEVSSGGTKIFIPFPEGTQFPNDFANSMFVEITLDQESHVAVTKNCLKGASLQ